MFLVRIGEERLEMLGDEPVEDAFFVLVALVAATRVEAGRFESHEPRERGPYLVRKSECVGWGLTPSRGDLPVPAPVQVKEPPPASTRASGSRQTSRRRRL